MRNKPVWYSLTQEHIRSAQQICIITRPKEMELGYLRSEYANV